MEKKFPRGAGLQYLFLDACFDDEDEDEDEAFQLGMDNLFDMLTKAPKLNTVDVTENVKSEHGKLKKRIRESEEKVKMLREFKKSVREQQFIGLVNNTDKDIKFTSKRLLMERVQVNLFIHISCGIDLEFLQEVNPKCRVSIDWAYKNLGLFTSTGNPNVTVSWLENYVCLDAGQTLTIKGDWSFNVE